MARSLSSPRIASSNTCEDPSLYRPVDIEPIYRVDILPRHVAGSSTTSNDNDVIRVVPNRYRGAMSTDPESRPILIEPEQMAGVWANDFEIVLGQHEFTLDFIRRHHSTDPAAGMLVARVAMPSELFND